ncbi:hypothetical protein HMPREF3222_02154 [Clostridium perfringens]|uniref:Uncharacterized protein n=1 Tax=Clostridium perfringens TaxID=1502 RepID=A0A133N187_CLOPF|nr:hypothetical protein HMPREF3222_02154 [Clostridium perfringens]
MPVSNIIIKLTNIFGELLDILLIMFVSFIKNYFDIASLFLRCFYTVFFIIINKIKTI